MSHPQGGQRAATGSEILVRAQAGDSRAVDTLFRRELPQLRHWALTRVPRAIWARADADDFVQLTFVRALRRYHHFTIRESATFQHYLRRILVNLVRDELRRAAREPESVDFSGIEDRATPDALDRVLGRETQRRYRAALATLARRTRTAVVARLEDAASYADIAVRIDASSAEAARAVVGRGVRRLVTEMRALSCKGRRPVAARSARRYR